VNKVYHNCQLYKFLKKIFNPENIFHLIFMKFCFILLLFSAMARQNKLALRAVKMLKQNYQMERRSAMKEKCA